MASTSASLVVTSVFVLLGLLIAGQARTPYNRYKTITDITSTTEGVDEPGTETVVRGTVTVAYPVTPRRDPPAPVAETIDSPAIWAWRIREKEPAGQQGQTRWRTVDGELAVGDFSVRHNWDRVRIDGDWLRCQLESSQEEPVDPFDSSALFLGPPEEDVPLGELNPLNKLLDRLGLRDDDGVFANFEMSLSIGSESTSPDRYQATIIEDGDELLVRGEMTETPDGFAIRGTDETPLMLATGNLEQRRKQLRSKWLWLAGIGLTLLCLGIAWFGAQLL